MSLHISALAGEPYKNFSELFLEGLYNPIVSNMYLISCRDVQAYRGVLLGRLMDHEDGFDCLIEVTVQYPPTTTRWLMNPAAKISITSQRTEGDPLHFSPIKFTTGPMIYPRQREEILSHKDVDSIFHIPILSMTIACALGQLSYMRDKANIVPFISLIVLGVQVPGYSLPLFAKMSSDPYETQYYYVQMGEGFQVIDYIVKFLVLVVFLLTLRLFQKVWKSRIRLLTHTPLELGHVPSDRWVFFSSFETHTIGFLIILLIHMMNASKRPLHLEKNSHLRGNSHKPCERVTILEESMGLLHDFFLLPQIIGNILWQIDCKPLRNMHYIGLMVASLLSHIYNYMKAPVLNPYNYMKAPVLNPYFLQEVEFVNSDLGFFSKFGHIAKPKISAILAIVVYFQQRWSRRGPGHKMRSGECRLLYLESGVYERPPLNSFEAELVSGVNESSAHGHLQRKEE